MHKQIWLIFCAVGISSCFEEKEPAFGILDGFIKEAIENVKKDLVDVKIDHQLFKSGSQEFGNLEGYVKNVVVKDLDKFDLVRLDTFLININNLTTMHKEFSLKGFYDLNGTLAFPLGRNDIHFFGAGDMDMKFKNFTVSMSLKLQWEGIKKVKELNIFMNFGGFEVQMKNLMGGGDLENVFNILVNDVGLTVFDYYKDTILKEIKPALIEKINELLNA